MAEDDLLTLVDEIIQQNAPKSVVKERVRSRAPSGEDRQTPEVPAKRSKIRNEHPSPLPALPADSQQAFKPGGKGEKVKCTVCSASRCSKNLDSLANHGATHMENYWKCSVCAKSLYSATAVKDHARSKHHSDLAATPVLTISPEEYRDKLTAKLVDCFPTVFG